MPKIVQVKMRHAQLADDTLPVDELVEVAASQRSTGRTGENRGVGFRQHVDVQVGGQHGGHWFGYGDLAHAGPGLGRPELECTVGPFDVGRADCDHSGSDLDVASVQRRDFAPAEAGEGGRGDEGGEPGWHGHAQLLHLADGQHRPPGWLLVTRAANAAGVAFDDVVVDRGVENGAQQPVSLGGHGGGDAILEQRCSPSAYDERGEVFEARARQLWREVALVQPAVQIDGAGP